ncbi:MAG: pyruvate kinase, partial [Candidatus Peregrinibacteria bacterium]
LSHGKNPDRIPVIEAIRELRKEGFPIGIMFDTKGAEIRTGEISHPIEIKKGQEVVFSPHPLPEEKRTVISVNYEEFKNDVRETDRILLDNGTMIFDIVEIQSDGSVVARSQDDGNIGSRRHVTLPGADIDLPSITERDFLDIAFGIEQGVDYFSLSFVRSAEDIESVRRYLKDKKSHARIIAKIESQSAVDHLAEIIAATDALMVARGDLGSDLPFEDLPALQDEIVIRCRDEGKPVIVATHMLESMCEHPMPTRAEVTDVAHAVMSRADATMLSGETASGKYPEKALEAMDRIIRKTEEYLRRFPMREDIPVHNAREARAEAANGLVASTSSSALFVFTKSGQTAREVSRFRPHVPIIAFTDAPATQHSLALSYGVHPLVIPFSANPESTVQAGMEAAIAHDFVQRGDHVVLLSDAQAKNAPVQSVQLRTVE